MVTLLAIAPPPLYGLLVQDAKIAINSALKAPLPQVCGMAPNFLIPVMVFLRGASDLHFLKCWLTLVTVQT